MSKIKRSLDEAEWDERKKNEPKVKFLDGNKYDSDWVLFGGVKYNRGAWDRKLKNEELSNESK